MMDAQLCPACGGDSDSCYCPGVPLASIPSPGIAAPRPANPWPAVPPPATGERGLEWRTPRPWIYASAMIHEDRPAPGTIAELELYVLAEGGDVDALARLTAGDTLIVFGHL